MTQGHSLLRTGTARWIVLGAALSLWPFAARADDLATALTMISKGDLQAAQVLLHKTVTQDPQNAGAHYWLGRVSFDLGDPVAGEREADAAQARGFDKRQTTRLLGQALLAQTKYDTVLRTMQPDGKDADLDAAILVLRGYALIGVNKPGDAQAALGAAEQRAPDSAEPPLAESRLALLRGDLVTAQAKLDRALALQPKAPEALLAKAQLLRMQGHPNDALMVLNGLLGGPLSMPDAVQAHIDRAGLEILLDRPEQARGDIGMVLAATPGSVQAVYLQAALATQTKDYADADAKLTRISPYLDQIPRAYLLVAIVKQQLGQLEQAETAAQHYLAQAPNDLAAYNVTALIQNDKHRPDLVIATLSRFAASGKADAETFELLGAAYAATGQVQHALDAYQNAWLLAPTDIGLQTRLASLRVGAGEPNVAVADLEHTLVMAPKAPEVGEALFFAALATGDLGATNLALDKIRAAEGDTATVEHLQGLLQQAQLDLGGARRTFAAVAAKYPDFLPAKISLAHVLAMQGDPRGADKLLADVLSRQPTAEPALDLLVSDEMQDNHVADATTLLQHALAADPDNPGHTVALGDLFIRTGTAQKALDLVNQINGERRSAVEILSLKAKAELALGNKDAARDTFIALLKQYPNDLGARQALFELLFAAGDFEAARNVVRDGMAATPRAYPLLQDYVMIEKQAHGVDAALATADQLWAEDRTFAAAGALRGDVLVAANRPDDAIAAFAAAFATAPSWPLLARLVGAQVRYGHIEAARTTLLHWLDQQPRDVRAREQLAQLDIATGRLDDAAGTLRVLLDDRPHDPVALNNLAWIYQQQNDPRALELARQAYMLAPNAQSADTLGWILARAGYADMGVPLLRQADIVSQGDPRMRYHFAVALNDLGDRDEAIKLLTSVVAAKRAMPETAQARHLLDELRQSR